MTETDGKCIFAIGNYDNHPTVPNTVDEEEEEDFLNISQTSWQLVSEDDVEDAVNQSMLASQDGIIDEEGEEDE